MANTVYESQTNEHILVKFLADLHSMLDDKTVWGSHLGSETLMRRHKNTRTRIACITVLEKRRNEIELRKKQEAAETSLEALPEECVREILCKLSDYRDVENAGIRQHIVFQQNPSKNFDKFPSNWVVIFIFRPHHTNYEIYCVRKEDLEGTSAGI